MTDSQHKTAHKIKCYKVVVKWNDKIAGLPSCERKIKVIQGTGDTTVDWRFNIKFLRRKFSDVDVSLIKKGRHELFNESAELRNEVFSQISGYLGNR